MAKKILIIDDDPIIRELIQQILESLTDLKILTAQSGIEGLKKADLEKPDAILLDVMMPVLDGIATFKKLKQNPHTENIPTIFLTAKNLSMDREEFTRLGAKGTISKPFKINDLVEQISNLVDS